MNSETNIHFYDEKTKNKIKLATTQISLFFAAVFLWISGITSIGQFILKTFPTHSCVIMGVFVGKLGPYPF